VYSNSDDWEGDETGSCLSPSYESGHGSDIILGPRGIVDDILGEVASILAPVLGSPSPTAPPSSLSNPSSTSTDDSDHSIHSEGDEILDPITFSGIFFR
jgi:hypothetical protein